MKNSFNLEVNFSNSPTYPYEWSSSSMLMGIKAIRVSTSLLKNVLTHEGTINLKGTILLSDAKNAVAVKLDEKGAIKARSFLKFEDELDVIEYVSNLKESKIEAEFSKIKVPYERELSIELEMKKYLKERIENCTNEDLSRYLYYLYFDEINDYSREKLLSSIEKNSIDKNLILYKFLIES